ncbi:DUF1036 domain-containing protein [Caulobacter sp. 17J65-9]|uniref:DUF1036 domain-containing protein n=1 Tax=Caulobacter sp. 17J65-9 TaxID=2709382 RepID=UPI0013CAFCFB|nr:DUF1036 domain-containing protein [Caulobacter sp. 17J65-9]NEX91879.1 DUF1036 domain-containing protein [Caulobacter sp. 17J65-9]
MNITTSGRALLAAGLVLAATTSGPAPSARADARYVEVDFCNDDDQVISVAMAHYDTPLFGQYVIRGWYTIAPHTCRHEDIARGGVLYTFAGSPDGHEWDGDTRFCVPLKAFNRPATQEDECAEGEAPFRFEAHVLPWDDTYTVRFSR